MQIIVKLESTSGKTITERIKASCEKVASKIAISRNKGCSIVDTYQDRKQSRRSISKDRW